ncbi:MAG: hypothetical protein B6I34_08155 [Anaerolineaceae bacterium 4572_32.1]|nr:MAG: hypothetical protein B6I34_08155 [Anaerolineaceae bacterium 4572_32.1]
MIDVNELRKGTTFTMDGEIYKVIKYQHHKPGRGKATIRTKIRNLRTGTTIDKNFISGDRVEEIRIDKVEAQYLYNDGQFYHFMNTETYEQPALPASALEEALDYLTENMTLILSFYEGEPIDVILPTAVDLQVADAPMAIAGDTATGATKQVTVETHPR